MRSGHRLLPIAEPTCRSQRASSLPHVLPIHCPRHNVPQPSICPHRQDLRGRGLMNRKGRQGHKAFNTFLCALCDPCGEFWLLKGHRVTPVIKTYPQPSQSLPSKCTKVAVALYGRRRPSLRSPFPGKQSILHEQCYTLSQHLCITKVSHHNSLGLHEYWLT